MHLVDVIVTVVKVPVDYVLTMAFRVIVITKFSMNFKYCMCDHFAIHFSRDVRKSDSPVTQESDILFDIT